MSPMRPTAGPNPFLDATAWQMLERVAARFPIARPSWPRTAA